MRLFVLLVCLALSAEASDCQQDEDDRTLAAQNMRLESLQEKLQRFRSGVKDKLGEVEEIQRQIGLLKSRLHKAEDTGCDDRYYLQCGGEKPLCLSRLLVCDTYKDCDNGYDESECETYTPSGSVWKGTMIYDHCTKLRPQHMKFTVDNYKIIDYFRPFPIISATLELDYDKPDYQTGNEIKLEGWMDLKPGNHIVYYKPPHDDGLAISCSFDGIDTDHCRGSILHEGSQSVCAEFYAERIDHHN